MTQAKHIVLTWEEFAEQFKPVKNALDPNASLDGFMFETYGLEYEFVQKKAAENPNCVWTLVDDGEGSEITNGPHFVNRMGYLVTSVPAADNAFYSVDQYTYNDSEEE